MCETRDARWLCEWQCTVVVTNKSELSVCPLTVCEGSNSVQYFALSLVLKLSANTCHVLSGKLPNNRLCKPVCEKNMNCERGVTVAKQVLTRCNDHENRLWEMRTVAKRKMKDLRK